MTANHIVSCLIKFLEHITVMWCENDDISLNCWINCLFNSMFRLTAKLILKLCITGSLWGEFADDWWFPWTEMWKTFPFPDIIMVLKSSFYFIFTSILRQWYKPDEVYMISSKNKNQLILRILPLNIILYKVANPYTTGNAWMHAQHCGYWCPGA